MLLRILFVFEMVEELTVADLRCFKDCVLRGWSLAGGDELLWRGYEHSYLPIEPESDFYDVG